MAWAACSVSLITAWAARHRSHGCHGHWRDSVTNVTEYIGNGDSLTTLANLPKNDSAGLEITFDGHIVPTLAYAVSADLFYSQIDATALGSPGLQSTTGVNGKLTLDYRPTADDSAQIMVSLTDKHLTPQGHISAINIVNIGYKRQLQPDLTAIVIVSDVFNASVTKESIMPPPLPPLTFEPCAVGASMWVWSMPSVKQKKSKAGDFQYD